MSKKKDADIRIRVTKEFKRRVQAIADSEDLDVSDIGRRALKAYLETSEPKKKRKMSIGEKYPLD